MTNETYKKEALRKDTLKFETCAFNGELYYLEQHL